MLCWNSSCAEVRHIEVLTYEGCLIRNYLYTSNIIHVKCLILCEKKRVCFWYTDVLAVKSVVYFGPRFSGSPLSCIFLPKKKIFFLQYLICLLLLFLICSNDYNSNDTTIVTITIYKWCKKKLFPRHMLLPYHILLLIVSR